MIKLMIIVGSVRVGRLGAPIGNWVQNAADSDGRFEVDLADLGVVALPMMDEPNHPRLRTYTQQHTLEWSDRVASADAFIFVTPEYNAGYTAPLKNAIDYLYYEWHHKPVGMVSYGGISAGTRGVSNLRQVTGGLGLVQTLRNVEIAWAASQLDGDGFFAPTDRDKLSLSAQLDELVQLGESLASLRSM